MSVVVVPCRTCTSSSLTEAAAPSRSPPHRHTPPTLRSKAEHYCRNHQRCTAQSTQSAYANGPINTQSPPSMHTRISALGEAEQSVLLRGSISVHEGWAICGRPGGPLIGSLFTAPGRLDDMDKVLGRACRGEDGFPSAWVENVIAA
jgi:hypothetical protein